MKFFTENKKISFTVSVLIIILIVFLIFLLMSLTSSPIKKYIAIESGEPIPPIESFFVNAETTGTFVTNISAVNTNIVGKINIELDINGKKCTSVLKIEDTIAPTGDPVEQYIFKGNEIKAEDFITNIKDATIVTCSFDSLPDVNKMGWNDIVVILTDEGGNSTNIKSKFYVFDIISELVVEAGDVKKFTPKDFINNYMETKNLFLDDEIDYIDFSALGVYYLNLKSGNYVFPVSVKIEDTIPPKGEAVEQYIFKGNEIKAEDLVENIEDVTKTTCSFASPFDLNEPGWHNVTVIIIDEGENITKVESKFYVFDFLDELIIEAGAISALPAAKEFILNFDNIDINIGDISLKIESDLDDFLVLGSHNISLKFGEYSASSVLKIEDTIPPTGNAVERYIFKGNEIKAGDLVEEIKDATKVICTFDLPPDLNKLGWQDVIIILTDEGGNSSKIASKFYTFDTIREIVIEAGSVNSLSIKNFVKNVNENYDGLSFFPNGELKFSIPGSYSVNLKSDKYSIPATVKIVDTTAPVADIKNCWTYKNKTIPASSFVYNIRDVSPVTVKYKNTPDFSVQGIQFVYLGLEDTYKNSSEYKAELEVVVDTTPPIISGDINKWVIVGSSIAYRSGITVTDDYDSKVQLVVDSSAVNLNKPGAYTVIYSSADESGNKTEVKGIITVRAVDMALVNEMADNILSTIVTKNMSQYNKAKAIYNWVHIKMKYSANKSSRDIAQRAYECFTKGSGDCYTYMAASQVLLTRAGIQNVVVQRYSGASTPHYWNIINIGSGWYHFDVCPTPGNAVTIDQRFMFTESQAREYTETIKTNYAYYQYDKSSVPEVVE